MENLDLAQASLGELDKALAATLGAPRVEDWSRLEACATEVIRTWRSLENPVDRAQLGAVGAERLGQAGARLHAQGRPSGRQLLRAALEMSPETPGLRYAVEQPDGWAKVLEASDWLEQRKPRQAKALLKTVREQHPNPHLEATIKSVLAMGMPLRSAPTLYTMNGVGTMMAGRRDQDSDGTWVSTLCFSVVLPLIPLSAYRVYTLGGGSYEFYREVPLSPFARWMRGLVLGSALAAVLGFITHTWWTSTAQVHRRAFAAAEAKVEAGEPADDIWFAFAADHQGSHLARPAIDRWFEARRRRVKAPIEGADVSELESTIHSLGYLAEGRHLWSPLTEQVLGWHAWTPPEGRTQVLRALHRGGSESLEPETGKRLNLALASELSESEPLTALELLTPHLAEAEVRRQSYALVDAISTNWSKVQEQAAVLTRWQQAVEGFEDAAPTLETLHAAQALGTERLADPRRTARLASHRETKLRAGVAKDPGDDAMAMAWAQTLSERGDIEGATKALLRVFDGAILTNEAQTELVRLWMLSGRLAEADALLNGRVQSRLPELAAAREAYASAAGALERRLEHQAEMGHLPPDLHRVARSGDEMKIAMAWNAWVEDALASDPGVIKARVRYQRAAEVVGAVLDLGALRIQRADGLEGEERERMLVSAETLFRSIATEGEGAPGFHLSLGTIQHRLGNREQGDAEFERVLALADPEWDAEVARAYRRLGLVEPAIQIAKRAYGKSSGAVRDGLARVMAVMSQTLEERRQWLERISTPNPHDEATLADLRADEAEQTGDLTSAASFAAAAAEKWGAIGARNNRARSLSHQFELEGREALLRQAIEELETVLASTPDASIPATNLASLEVLRVMAHTIYGLLGEEGLPLDLSSAGPALALLAPDRDELRALVSTPDYQATLERLRRAQVLAPAHTATYDLQWSILGAQRDQAGLARLLERSRQHVELPPAVFDEALILESLQVQDARARRLLEKARRPRTKGLAEALIAENLIRLATVRLDPSLLEQAEALLHRAKQHGPRLDTSSMARDLAEASLAIELLASHEALTRRYQEEQWQGYFIHFVAQLAKEGDVRLKEALPKAEGLPAMLEAGAQTAHPAFGRALLMELLGEPVPPEVYRAPTHQLQVELSRVLRNSPSQHAIADLFRERVETYGAASSEAEGGAR